MKKNDKPTDSAERKPKRTNPKKTATAPPDVLASAPEPKAPPAVQQVGTATREIAATITITPSQQAIAARAFEIWVRSGKKPGHDLENWLAAEGDVRATLPAPRIN